MKRKGLPVAILALAVMVVLGGLGVVYGAWTQQLTVTGTVNTATFDVHFTQSSLGPSVLGDGTVNCTDLQGDNSAAISGTVGNVTPGHGCTFSASIDNNSSVPVSVQPPTFSAPPWLNTSSSVTADLSLANKSISSPQTFTVSANNNLGASTTSSSGTAKFTMIASQDDGSLLSMIKYYNPVILVGSTPTFARSTTPVSSGVIGTQTVNGGGSVTVADTTADTASIYSGFDIVYGRWGDLKTKTITINGSGSWAANLWFDTTGATGNGDGEFFAWNNSTPDLYTGYNGDTRIVDFANNSSPSKNMSTIDVTTVAPTPDHSVTDDTLVAIWIGTGPGQSATINSVTIN